MFAVPSASSFSLLILRSHLWDCKYLASSKIFPDHSIFCLDTARPSWASSGVLSVQWHVHAVPEQCLGSCMQSHGLNWSQLSKVMEVGIKPGEHMKYVGTKVSPVRQNYTAKLKEATSTIAVAGQGVGMRQMSIKEDFWFWLCSCRQTANATSCPHSFQVPCKVWTVSGGRLMWMRMSCIFKLQLMTKEKKKESVRIIA